MHATVPSRFEADCNTPRGQLASKHYNDAIRFHTLQARTAAAAACGVVPAMISRAG